MRRAYTVNREAAPDGSRERVRPRSQLKGRQADEASLREVGELIGPPDAGDGDGGGEGRYRRDLLIEHLHRLNDAHGCLRERHLAALAKLMNLPMAEVFEVASFYHHFEIVRGDGAAPGLAVRVCESLACEMAGAKDLLARLPALLGEGVRVIAAPCLGRCEQAPAVAVHQRAVPRATADEVAAMARAMRSGESPRGQAPGAAIGYAAYRADGEIGRAHV
jgi:formate dehydrogenase